jgi:hypothetical protein
MKSTDIAKIILDKRYNYYLENRLYPSEMWVNEKYYNELNRGWCLITEEGNLYGMRVIIDNELRDKGIIMC